MNIDKSGSIKDRESTVLGERFIMFDNIHCIISSVHKYRLFVAAVVNFVYNFGAS